MKKYLKYLLIIIVLLGICFVVFKTGQVSNSCYKSQINAYMADKVRFCDLDENDRLVVCSNLRLGFIFPDGGIAVLYECNQNLGYIETYDLQAKGNRWANNFFTRASLQGFQIKKICEKDDGITTYKLEK